MRLHTPRNYRHTTRALQIRGRKRFMTFEEVTAIQEFRRFPYQAGKNYC